MKMILNSQAQIPILCEDDVIHTQTTPFCTDPSCPCHLDQELITSVHQQVLDGLLTEAEADRLYRGKQL